MGLGELFLSLTSVMAVTVKGECWIAMSYRQGYWHQGSTVPLTSIIP
jgi:hypothetical protein